MSIPQVPRCSFLMMAFDPGKVSEPENTPVMERSIPSEVHPFQARLLEDIAKDYIFHCIQERKDALPTLTARLSFSIERGIEFENCSHSDFEEMITIHFQQAIPFARDEARKLGEIHRIQPTEQMLCQLPDSLNPVDLEFIDAMAVSLVKQGATQPLTVDLEVRTFFPANKGQGLTTGNLRFPHLLLAMRERLLRGDHSTVPNVCIVGPGLFEYDEKITPTCPQFVEMFSLFPEGRFTLLDNDPHSLKSMDEMFSRRIASYDSVMLRAYATENFGEATNSYYVAEDDYQATFSAMKDNLATRAIAPRNAREMLDGVGKILPLTLLLDQGQVEVCAFDILSSDFHGGEQFDIIVATMSIVNAFAKDLEAAPFANHFELLAKFLLALNENGAFYIDTKIIMAIKERWGSEGFALGIRYLETLLGNELHIEEVVTPSFTGGRGTILNLSAHKPLGLEHRPDMKVTTSDIMILTRSEVVVDQGEHVAAKRALDAYLAMFTHAEEEDEKVQQFVSR